MIHNSRYWAYNTKSVSRKDLFIDIMAQFIDIENDFAEVYFSLMGERISLLNHDIKTFKYSHDFFHKLPTRIDRANYPQEMGFLVDKLKNLCYQSHARLSMR